MLGHLLQLNAYSIRNCPIANAHTSFFHSVLQLHSELNDVLRCRLSRVACAVLPRYVTLCSFHTNGRSPGRAAFRGMGEWSAAQSQSQNRAWNRSGRSLSLARVIFPPFWSIYVSNLVNRLRSGDICLPALQGERGSHRLEIPDTETTIEEENATLPPAESATLRPQRPMLMFFSQLTCEAEFM